MKKTVVVTGGTKGIGRAISFKLAQQHYNVVINYLSDDSSAIETLNICKQYNADIMLVKADVSRKCDVEMLFREIAQKFNTIDVLINNAGLNIDKPLLDMEEEDWDRVVNTNMKGVFLCSQAASKYMFRQDHEGIIINIGSTTGIRGRSNGVNYCASKAGVLVMTKCLALEMSPKIRVNCVIPGFTVTGETIKRYNLDNQENIESKKQTIPLRRLGTPEEVADVVCFVISDQARYINGQKIIVDGGQFMF